MGRLGHKKTLLSGWTATQEADQQGGAIHVRPLPRHRTLPGAYAVFLESTVTTLQIRCHIFSSGSTLPNLQSNTYASNICVGVWQSAGIFDTGG
jgi:hypothetical protein